MEHGPDNVAPRDGKYVLDGVQFRTFKGAPLPPGAVMVPDEDERSKAAAPETEAKPKAPENKARTRAPETKAKD